MAFNWIIFALIAPSLISGAKIQLIDITPEEAQRLITQQSLDLRYATKISEGSASGRSYNGKIIDSNDYAEEIYDANQFHGQDGLGRAIFGYTDNKQSRLEARNANGEVRGQYQYLDPFGNDIQVQYWVDSLGFHQTDNRPEYESQPVTETPEVRQAREEHERLWKEAARLNGVDLDSTDLYSSAAENLENDNYDDDDRDLEGQVSNQHQSLSRYPILPYSEHIAPDNAKSFGEVTSDSVIVETNSNKNQRSRFARQQRNEVEEVTSEPRGFFYSFDYPVPFIVDRNARLRLGPDAEASERFDVRVEADDKKIIDADDKKTIEEPSKNKFQQVRISENIRDKIIPEDEVHDVQVSPKQREKNVVDVRKEIVSEDEVHDLQVSPKQRAKSVATSKEFKDNIPSTKTAVNRGRGSVRFNKTNNR